MSMSDKLFEFTVNTLIVSGMLYSCGFIWGYSTQHGKDSYDHTNIKH